MTNVFGEGIDYEIDGEEILNEVNAKIKMMNIVNEKKFIDVNELKINNLKIKEQIKNFKTEINEKFKTEIANFKTETKTELVNFKEQLKKENDKFKTELVNFKEQLKKENDNFKEQLKKENDNYKKEINVDIIGYRNKIIDLNTLVTDLEKRLKEISITSTHLLNAKRKMTEAEKKAGKYFKTTFNEAAKTYYKEKYNFSDEEFEAFKQYIEIKKALL